MYVAFWYPTIFHKELDLNKEKTLQRFTIDDGSNYSYWVTLKYIQDNYNSNSIEIISELTNNNGEKNTFTVILTEIDKSNNGFAIYKCDETTIPEEYRKIFFEDSVLLKPIYHRIKEFYHIHEADKEKDSALQAQCNLKGFNNVSDCLLKGDFLLNLLLDFETLFRASANTISHHNALSQEKFDKFKNEKDKEKLEELIEETKKLNRLCENALIEYTYCKTLLTSIYNKYFHHNAEVKLVKVNDTDQTIKQKVKNIEFRRKALNIRNAIRYIENIKYKNQNRQNFIIYEQNIILTQILKNSERTQQTSMIFTVLGVLYALLFGFRQEIEKITFLNFQYWWQFLLCIISGSVLILLFIKKQTSIKLER